MLVGRLDYTKFQCQTSKGFGSLHLYCTSVILRFLIRRLPKPVLNILLLHQY